MKIWHLSPMKCSICGLYACYQELPVCHHCMHVFQDMLTEKCEKCGRPPYSCDCYGNISYLFFFNSFDSKLFLYFVKCNGERRVMRFLAELAVKIYGINPNAYDGVTYVPRLPRRTRRYGYDQSKEFAKALSEILGIPLIKTLKRVGGRQQKLLSYSQRIRNIKDCFKIIHIPQEKYKRLLLVDDIITTGATVKVCSDLLRENLTKSVKVLAMAKTPKRK